MESSMKNLALPWHYQEGADAYTHIVRDAKNGYVCCCSDILRNNEDQARARFIVLAANCHEKLLHGAVAAHHTVMSLLAVRDGITDELLRELADFLQAAIDKAEGRS